MSARHRERTQRRKTRQQLSTATRVQSTAPAGDTEDAAPATLDELRDQVRQALHDVVADADLVQLLTTTHQRRMIVLTAETKAAMATMAIAEREAQAERQKKGEPLGHGPIATPGNTAAISMGDEITRSLHRILIDLIDYDLFTTIPPLTGLDKVHRTASRIRLWTAAADEPDRPALERTVQALEDLDVRIRALVDGHNERSVLRDPCPHCSNQTLIVLWDEQLIRCDRSPHARHYQHCQCSDPLCECKQRPIGYRHTWFAGRPARSPHSWHTLASRLNANRAATPEKK